MRVPLRGVGVFISLQSAVLASLKPALLVFRLPLPNHNTQPETASNAVSQSTNYNKLFFIDFHVFIALSFSHFGA